MVSTVLAATVATVAAVEAAIAASVVLSMGVEDDADRVVVPVPVEGTTTIGNVGAVGGADLGRPRGGSDRGGCKDIFCFANN